MTRSQVSLLAAAKEARRIIRIHLNTTIECNSLIAEDGGIVPDTLDPIAAEGVAELTHVLWRLNAAIATAGCRKVAK